MFQCCISRALNGNFNGSLGPCLTLSAHYNEGDICYIAVCAQLAVVVVDLLEAGLVSQQLQVLLQLQVVLVEEAVEGQLHVPELGQQPGGREHDSILDSPVPWPPAHIRIRISFIGQVSLHKQGI